MNFYQYFLHISVYDSMSLRVREREMKTFYLLLQKRLVISKVEYNSRIMYDV